MSPKRKNQQPKAADNSNKTSNKKYYKKYIKNKQGQGQNQASENWYQYRRPIQQRYFANDYDYSNHNVPLDTGHGLDFDQQNRKRSHLGTKDFRAIKRKKFLRNSKKDNTNKDNVSKNNINKDNISKDNTRKDNINNSPASPPKTGKSNQQDKMWSLNATDTHRWLLHPHEPSEFLKIHWEKGPLYVKRNDSQYYNVLNINTDSFNNLMNDNQVLFGKNIDVTTYVDGVRETHNPEGRAYAHIVWDFFKNGCSIRLLNPQTYFHQLYRVNELLQNVYNCFVGANMYLTPPNSQGFAPHYDDIEAFVLQLQGRKYWKVYNPRNGDEKLPRYSSNNFTDDDIGIPILEVELKPGDLLYFPRGFIHQASTRDELSLHITISTYQCTAYVDLLDKLLPQTLKDVASKCVQFRKGLPLDYSEVFGSSLPSVLDKHKKARRQIIKNEISSLMTTLLNNLDIDAAVDSLCAQSLHDRLPPHFNKGEKQSTVFGNSTKLSPDGKEVNVIQLTLNTSVRLRNPKICRLVKKDGKYLLYFTTNNSMEYHGNEQEFLEVDNGNIEAYRKLANIYPTYMAVSKLPIDSDEDKWAFANSLWEVGLLRTSSPIKPIKMDFTNVKSDEEIEDEVDEENEEEEVGDEVDNKDVDYNLKAGDDNDEDNAPDGDDDDDDDSYVVVDEIVEDEDTENVNLGSDQNYSEIKNKRNSVENFETPRSSNNMKISQLEDVIFID